MPVSKYYACICEGTAEQKIIELLLDANKLIFTREELLEEKVLRCRSARNFEDKYLGKGFKNKITVYRILDSRNEKFKLRAAYQHKIDVVNIITAPEIEMLVIIKENAYKNYVKYKSKMKPSDFCINILKISRVKNAAFITKYFNDIDELIYVIKEYKRLSNIPDNEKCLADLLNC